jgi:hypothetical protein
MNNFYIYVSSDKFDEVSVTLPHELSEGRWKIGLAEVAFFKSKTKFPDMDVCCDIIAPNFKNNKSRQILRRVYADKGEVRIRYNPIFYCDVLSNTVKKVNIYLKAGTGDLTSFEDTVFNCTLHLRKDD